MHPRKEWSQIPTRPSAHKRAKRYAKRTGRILGELSTTALEEYLDREEARQRVAEPAAA